MTHLTPGGVNAPAMLAPVPPSLSPRFDRLKLRQAIADHRAALAALEAAMVADCERDAARGADRHVRIQDRETWDTAVWQRYVAAATRREPDYMPRMQRTLADIERLERLLAVLIAQQPLAA